MKVFVAEVEINFQAATALYDPALRFAFLTSSQKKQKTAKCKESKSLSVKKQVLGEATDAEPCNVVMVERAAADAEG